MKAQTKAVKGVLKKHYPDDNFAVKYKESYSYLSCGDRIIIGCPKHVELGAVKKLLGEHSKGIVICDEGEECTTSQQPETFFVDVYGRHVDADLVEILEVRHMLEKEEK